VEGTVVIVSVFLMPEIYNGKKEAEGGTGCGR
jgi:hypothetical protein